jgi:hypothetical protein
MPSSIGDLFRASNLEIAGTVSYGRPVREKWPGVYVVASTSDLNAGTGQSFLPTLDAALVERWMRYVPAMQLEDSPDLLTSTAMAKRLLEFWLPDEPVLYIGKAGTAIPSRRSIGDRVADLYDHVLGDPRPHRGGHWLKTLSDLDQKFVIWAAVMDGRSPQDVENEMLAHFVAGVSSASRATLRDSLRPFPWANLEYPKGNRKKHGILNQTL